MIDPRVIIEVLFLGVPIAAELIIGFLDVCALGIEQHRVFAETVIASADPVLYFREI